MKYGKSIIVWICIWLVLFAGKPGTVRATGTVPEVHTEEQEEDSGESCAEILQKERYVRVALGDCYPGSRVEFDIRRERAVLYPAEGEKRLVVRNKEETVLYYGRYRGKEEYDNYQMISPVLDAGFFSGPLKALDLTTKDVEAQQFQVKIDEEQELEFFFTPLVYAGVINGEEVELNSISISYDETYRPIEIRFILQSDILSLEQLLYLEEELIQRYDYMDLTEFGENFQEAQEITEETASEEEITIANYVTDLNNILRVKDAYFIQRLTHQGEELSYFAGWDKKAVFAYLEAVNTRFNAFGENGYEARNVTQEEYLQELENTYKSARQIGSDVYTYMFQESGIEPMKKALLVLRQMGAYLDESGMLQMGAGDRFAPEMTPHSAFLEEYAACVREAYAKNEHAYRQLDNKMIHQFRMYIDKHNIEYVRNNYKGPTDYERLKSYAKNYEMKLYYGEPSRHHNKVEGGKHFQGQKYDKILTPNHLSEFIINVETGEFVTQWDVLEIREDGTVGSTVSEYAKAGDKEEQKIVDTESFNYAPADYVDAHNSLDVLPASPSRDAKKSLYLENDLKRALKEIWESPKKLYYRERYKSSKDYLK